MTGDGDFDQINASKANMDHIYDQPDPRAYFRELKKLRYAIPDAAKPVFQKLISALRQRRKSKTVQILDLGSSYGVNAALLKHDLSMSELYDHWGQDKLAGATPEQVAEHDRRYFATLDDAKDIELIGLDQAKNAVTFAEQTGLLDDGLALDLETERLPEPAQETLASVDLVTSTGCVGYLTEKSFERLLPAVTQGQPAWIANFVLRMFPFGAIEQTLNDQGYVTEKLEGRTFTQRQFVSAEEQQEVLDALFEQGINPDGQETKGRLVAEFFLSRPADDAAESPIGRLALA